MLFGKQQLTNQTTTINVKWEPPGKGCYKLNTDGSGLGNPGAGGIGVIRNCRRDWAIGFRGGLPHATNTLTELTALMQGLKLAVDRSSHLWK